MNGELLAVASVTVSCDYAHKPNPPSGWPVERDEDYQKLIILGTGF